MSWEKIAIREKNKEIAYLKAEVKRLKELLALRDIPESEVMEGKFID